MTREEAIKVLNTYDVNFDEYTAEEIADAIDMAIEALQIQDICAELLESAKPASDAVSVVRCKDCRMTRGRDEHIGRWWCFVHRGYMADDYYCADGKRREDGESDETD